MAQQCLAGVVFVKVDGQQLSVRGTCTISPQPQTRTGLAGADGVHGFTCAWRVPYIEVEITERPAFSMDALYGVDDATVTAEIANGEVWVLRNAWQADEMVLDAIEGSLTVRFEGLSCVRQ